MKTVRYWAATPVYLVAILLALLADSIEGDQRDQPE